MAPPQSGCRRLGKATVAVTVAEVIDDPVEGP